MNFIIKSAKEKLWDSMFANGKLLVFLGEVHDNAFTPNGELHKYKQPPFSTFRRAISKI